MKKRTYLLMIFTVSLIWPCIIQAQEYMPEGYFGSINGSFHLLISNHPDLVWDDGLFNYSLAGFVMTGVDIGKYHGKHNFYLSLQRGFSILPESIEDEDTEPRDGEVELQNATSVAFSYRQQVSRIKETNRVVLNLGSRVTALYHNYSGVQATRHQDPFGAPPTYTFEEYGMNTFGIEAAPYLEIGKQAPGKKGIFFNWEFINFRFGYKHAALGLQKVSIILKF
ncbi:MAG: hypothetical protein MK198_11200 [Gracilimonas sp.]|uniref:hypothetical protein n=1 Tax=Gracilimonas sp. TaxID=1974203 RepID=UPI00375354A2|nr:hypothetical protein [Gracilimonas sp.]